MNFTQIDISKKARVLAAMGRSGCLFLCYLHLTRFIHRSMETPADQALDLIDQRVIKDDFYVNDGDLLVRLLTNGKKSLTVSSTRPECECIVDCENHFVCLNAKGEIEYDPWPADGRVVKGTRFYYLV